MKLMFISDIHGSLYYLEKALNRFKEEAAERLIILGDLLYHGPRNPLPEGYNPAEALKLLNSYKDYILCIRGNCDAEVDQMVLNFPIQADYAWLYIDELSVYMTHGHILNEEKLPPLKRGDILIQGHTHIPVAKQLEDIYILNPGSISLPKEGTPHTYGIFENREFIIKSLEGIVYKSIQF